MAIKGTWVRITEIGPVDAYYGQRSDLIGWVGTIEDLLDWGNGWFGGEFSVLGTKKYRMTFHNFKYEIINKKKKR